MQTILNYLTMCTEPILCYSDHQISHTSKNSTLDSDSEVSKSAVGRHRLTEDTIVDDIEHQRRWRLLQLHHMATRQLSATASGLAMMLANTMFYVRHPAD